MKVIYFCRTSNKFMEEKLEMEPSQISLGYLKQFASKAFTVPCDKLNVVYRGKLLSLEKGITLDESDGDCIFHVMDSPEEVSTDNEMVNNSEIDPQILSQLKNVRKAFHRTSHKHLMKLCEPEFLKNIIEVTPGLKNDRVAQQLLTDYQLLPHITEPSCLAKLQKQHPSIIEALVSMGAYLQKMAVVFRDDAFGGNDGMLSDDDLDGFDSAVNTGATGSTADDYNTSFNANFITATQLAAALAAAGAGTGATTSSQLGETASSGSNLSSLSQVTPQMFDIALQQALVNSTRPDVTGDQETRLRQMRELGITDDAISLRALEATGGNVDAAVGLVLGDWMDEA